QPRFPILGAAGLPAGGASGDAVPPSSPSHVSGAGTTLWVDRGDDLAGRGTSARSECAVDGVLRRSFVTVYLSRHSRFFGKENIWKATSLCFRQLSMRNTHCR